MLAFEPEKIIINSNTLVSVAYYQSSTAGIREAIWASTFVQVRALIYSADK